MRMNWFVWVGVGVAASNLREKEGGVGWEGHVCVCVHFRSLSRVFSVYFTVHIILNF